MPTPSGLLKAIVDAIQGQDEKIAGQRLTTLTTGLDAADTEMNVVSTVGFGEYTDGANDGQVIVGGEIIRASGRTATKFTGLTRGVNNTKIPDRHSSGLVVGDWARNSSGLDLVRRGFLTQYALSTDLDVIGRNHGLVRCPTWADDVWREIIEEIGYAGKQVIPLFHTALEIIVGAGNFEIEERCISEPYTIYIYVDVATANVLRGKFYLNSGEQQLTTGNFSVDTDYTIISSPLQPGPGTIGVYGVYDDVPATRRGVREGFTNYFTGGSYVGSTITLGSTPGSAGTPVLIDYNAFEAHYLPDNDAIRDDDDYYPYLGGGELLAVKCIIDQIRTTGVRVIIQDRP